ncbi:hypothetical protein V2I29_03110 [Campylobacter sp. CX2-8023-23]|uniref:hypothetical protein n=1 Tax=Campylobacter porcelli TaxID=1660073 RepID=UPI002EA2B1A2|nr:hypothetical protein [Campylobacter sp. CX2-8023-23]
MEQYDYLAQTYDEHIQKLNLDDKLNYLISQYQRYFSKDDIVVLIDYLSRRDRQNKDSSDICNLLFDIVSLSIEYSEYTNEPLEYMLETINKER